MSNIYDSLTCTQKEIAAQSFGPREGKRCAYTGIWLQTPLTAEEHVRDLLQCVRMEGMVMDEYKRTPPLAIHDFMYKEQLGMPARERNTSPYDNNQKSRRTRRKP